MHLHRTRAWFRARTAPQNRVTTSEGKLPM
jgi:hypothetical protein